MAERARLYKLKTGILEFKYPVDTNQFADMDSVFPDSKDCRVPETLRAPFMYIAEFDELYIADRWYQVLLDRATVVSKAAFPGFVKELALILFPEIIVSP